MRDELAASHKLNTLKLSNLDEFTVNPFLWNYLANYLEGNNDYASLAKALVYPRVLGTSITTSFGSRAQDLITRLFAGGSGIPGIDIEFIDKTDGRKKYCQVKAGPNVVNRDDVTSIKDHFRALKNLARTNRLELQTTDMIFGLLYGEEGEENSFILQIEKEYVVSIGRAFWYRFTGDPGFYADLVKAFGDVANEFDMSETLDGVIEELAKDIQKKHKIMFEK